jgi:A/G-specific adenine glycosylase
VDGNVERVLCRLEGWEADGSAAFRRKIEALAARLLDKRQPGDFNQAMMELGAMVCTPRNPQCKLCPLFADCKTHGEHKTATRAAMVTREIGVALCVRKRREVLLERRPDHATVMPGMWELPALRRLNFPEHQLRITVRHAIMQVNYRVQVRDVAEGEVKKLTATGGERRWVTVKEAQAMALTGLARKILRRAQLLLGAKIAP